VAQIFTAQGPRRTLHAEFMTRYPGELLLRGISEERTRCPYNTPHIRCTDVPRELPEGSHRLRVAHAGTDDRTLAEAVKEHAIVVAGESAQRRTGP